LRVLAVEKRGILVEQRPHGGQIAGTNRVKKELGFAHTHSTEDCLIAGGIVQANRLLAKLR